MHPALIVLLVIVGLLIILTPGLLISTHIVYKEAFYVKRLEKQERSFLKGEQYKVFQDQINKDVDEVLAEPYEEISVTSYDGKRLQGYLYKFVFDIAVQGNFRFLDGSAEFIYLLCLSYLLLRSCFRSCNH